jgi:tRNA nucleotidyltransferase (CCA-adding enzyme)
VLLQDYALWLSTLRSLDLLDAYLLKPLADGTDISAALGAKNGPWLKRALEMTIEWQLRNPDETEKEDCIAEIISRKKELGL